MPLDQSNDTNRAGLYQISQCTEIPAFVKEASFSSATLIQDLPPTAFADPDRRKYPMHSGPDTWMSCAYFAKFAAQEYDSCTYRQIKENLEKGCRFWRIEPPKLHLAQKEAAAEVEYGDGQAVFQKVAVHTSADVQVLAQDLVEHRNRYTWSIRHTVARQLLKLAQDLNADLGLEITGSLQKMAGQAVGSASRLQQQLDIRRTAVNDSALQERLAQVQKMAAELRQGDLLPPGFTEKVARLMDYVDRLTGLHQRYSGELCPPEHLFRFTLQDRDMLHKAAVRLPDGSVISHKEAESPAVSQLLTALTGKALDKAAALATLANLSPRECRLVTQAAAQA